MILEDLVQSESIKMDLVFQREELESLIETLNNNNEDVKFVCEQQLQHNNNDWDSIKQSLINKKERNLLLNLIIELQQYILGMSSNTTDNSVMQSDDLEDLQMMLENGQIETDQAI